MSLVITKYATINKVRATINGRVVLENEGNLDFKKFIRAFYKHFNVDYPKFFKMDSLSKLGFLSADILLQTESLLNKYPEEKIGIILSNASSSLEVDEKHWNTIKNREQYFPSPSNLVYTLPNIMAGEVAIKHKFKGENTVLISEAFDAELIYDVTSLAFSTGALNCCICGWVEQYADHYESLLFLIEEDESQKSGEGIIFEPSKLLNIYKQEQ